MHLCPGGQSPRVGPYLQTDKKSSDLQGHTAAALSYTHTHKQYMNNARNVKDSGLNNTNILIQSSFAAGAAGSSFLLQLLLPPEQSHSFQWIEFNKMHFFDFFFQRLN